MDMTDDASVLDNMIGTGNVALDGILNYMCSKALKNNIQVTRKITVPEDAELVAYDMNIILGNLLDNAIENALKTDEPKIDIVIKYRWGCCVLTLLIAAYMTRILLMESIYPRSWTRLRTMDMA